MNHHPKFKKTALCTLISALILPIGAIAAPLPLVETPAGSADRTPAPNVLISVDDSGSMAGTKMNTLRAALTSVFNNMALLPDGRIRLAWQVMWNNGGSPSAGNVVAGNVNSMKVLDATHRANFQSFVNSLTANSGTPSLSMMRQADAYMRTPQGINSPWASVPGTTELPYLGCRRAYHIFMTDGRWNNIRTGDQAIGNVDGTSTTFPDGQGYAPGTADTRIYGDAWAQTTLSDWAFRSWSTDLQPGIADEVKPGADYLNAPTTETIGGVAFPKYWNPQYNPATWQHMVTYSIGYGNDAVTWGTAPGIIRPSNTRPFGWDGSFPALMTGTRAWPDLSPNETNRSLDLWHSAINGRGRFYAVTANADLQAAFQSILQRINDENSSSVAGMAASGSSNFYENVGVYSAGYDASKAWAGYVYADTFATNGALTPDPNWGLGTGATPPSNHRTTADKLDALTNVFSRFILTTRDTDNVGSFFGWNVADNSLLTATQKALLDRGDSFGERRAWYIAGDRTWEMSNPGGVFRNRTSRQGDIVNSGVWYTGAPASNFSRLGYREFRQANDARLPMIYVGGNDGMLHGFSARNGDERIAYIPKGLIGKLWMLTDPAYSHRAFVDNTPFTGDVNLDESATTAAATRWTTMLVGTLGAGGRGYFVLDVTRPDTSFNFTNAANLVVMDKTLDSAATPAASSDDADIGHIYAAPVLHDTNPYLVTQITRVNNGRWAVILGNGYNSVNERPVLLIQYLDGAKELKKIVAAGFTAPDTAADTQTENGLSAPRVVDINGDGTADVVYAGDIKGNMWKFDLTSPNASDWGVAFGGTPLYTAKSAAVAGGPLRAQPITMAPTVKANDRGAGGMMVAFGTGRNLTIPDRADAEQQSIYSVLDNTRYKARNAPDADKLEIHPGGGICPGVTCIPAPAPVGTGVAMLQRQVVGASSTGSGSSMGRTFWNVSSNSVNWSTQKGWYLNFSEGRERALKPMSFYDSSNVLSVFTQVPATGSSSTGSDEACLAPVTQERQYLTLLNIMDGKPPSVSVMNRNGDAFYNAADGGVSRVTVGAGATSMVTSQNAITVFSGGVNAPPTVMRPMPETPIRPSWRQLQ